MSNQLELTCENTGQLPRMARQLLEFFGNNRIVLFEAPMGAGKTTLIKALCAQLGSKDVFSSPTFSIVNEYSSPNGSIFHFDLYRLKNQEELLDLGIEEYLDSGDWCFVEWPEKLESLLQHNYNKVDISVKGDIRYFRALKC